VPYIPRRIPSIVIGLTIVAFGTSAPELTVSVSSALKGSADIDIHNFSLLVAKIIILEVVMSKTIRMFAMFNEK